MHSIASDVIGGYNRFVSDQKLATVEEPVAEPSFTLIQFDSVEPFAVSIDGRPVSTVPDLTSETFRPRSGTPLYDAIAQTVAHVDEKCAAHEPAELRRLVVIFTDGEENGSRRHDRSTVMRLIEAKTELGWTFVFIGANQDSYAESGKMGIRRSGTQNWGANPEGVEAAFSSLSAATSRYMAEDTSSRYMAEAQGDSQSAGRAAAAAYDFFGGAGERLAEAVLGGGQALSEGAPRTNGKLPNPHGPFVRGTWPWPWDFSRSFGENLMALAFGLHGPRRAAVGGSGVASY